MDRGGAGIGMEVGAGLFEEDQGWKWAASGCGRAGSGAGSRCGHRFGAAESAGLWVRVPRGRGEPVVDVIHLWDDLRELRLLEDERERRPRHATGTTPSQASKQHTESHFLKEYLSLAFEGAGHALLSQQVF